MTTALPLMLLLLGGNPSAPSARSLRMVSARTESVSAVDASAAQRFGWATERGRSQAVAESLTRPPATGAAFAWLWPSFRAEQEWARSADPGGSEVKRAAGWIDSLPVKFDAQDGGMLVTMRLHGP